MIAQFVQFETSLSEAEVMAFAKACEADSAATLGLVQKFCLKLDKPNHFGGFLIRGSHAAMAAFAQTELARTIPNAYRIIGAPDVDIHGLLFPLWQGDTYAPETEAA